MIKIASQAHEWARSLPLRAQPEDRNNLKQKMISSAFPVRCAWSVLVIVLSLALLSQQALASDQNPEQATSSEATSVSGEHQHRGSHQSSQFDRNLPANHRMDMSQAGQQEEQGSDRKQTSARHGRQYDGALSASGTSSNYGAAMSGDSGAYVGSFGMASPNSGYNSPATAASNGGMLGYTSDPMGSSMHSPSASGSYHDQLSLAARAANYQAMHAGYPPPPPLPASFGGNGPLAPMFPGGGSGLFASSGFPLMAKGFDLAEVVCTAIAVAIGAVIIGAPFILLYLFIMNQMQGSGSNGMGGSGGAISLTGPTSSTNVNGRKKRHTNLSEALFKQLSPFVNNEQVAQTFRALMNSLAKYQA